MSTRLPAFCRRALRLACVVMLLAVAHAVAAWGQPAPASASNVPAALTGPFVTGFLNGEVVTGRPVGLVTGADGALYVSDDTRGFVYRVFARTGEVRR